MAQLAKATIVLAGIAGSGNAAAAAAGGDKFANSAGRTFLYISNGSGAPINVTATRQQTTRIVPGEGAVTLGNNVVAVPAGSSRLIGPFPETFNDADGNVNLSYSAVASVTVSAIDLPPLP